MLQNMLAKTGPADSSQLWLPEPTGFFFFFFKKQLNEKP